MFDIQSTSMAIDEAEADEISNIKEQCKILLLEMMLTIESLYRITIR